ncbi:cupin domain-containing protein [Corynebacterium lizhenjunii]|uniref:Cupin domain-containing protein n=1 Tax=Corynebacterium lizhenjunii TaxID=2709394 RepID=A0A7T0KDD9_9CORY|nr:cupin domain-containing protein [Corynebacterium lizhenjunii]QPK78434.1 cupin domain-containing protein [Corynebacterium lizhenjunii]
MDSLPLHDASTFGTPQTTGLEFLDLLADAPSADTTRARPAVQRLHSGARANHIVFTFSPGQTLPEHKAAHPITVQALRGEVEFSCQGTTHVLRPGTAVYLPAYVVHSVQAQQDAVMLLIMHTGD